MQAVILAGGRGSRLKPYTMVFPKPMVPVGDRPIIDILIRQLKRDGFRDLIVSTGHLAELVESYCGNGSRWGVKISYFREEKPLGTAGCLPFIKGLEKDFLVINGDVLTTLDYGGIFEKHLKLGGIATIGVSRRKLMIDFGVVKMSEKNELADYIEKPTYNFLVSMGINMLSRKCTKYIQKGEHIDMPDLLMRIKKRGEKIFCYPTNCYWLDIGRVDDYELAQSEFEKKKSRFLRGA